MMVFVATPQSTTPTKQLIACAQRHFLPSWRKPPLPVCGLKSSSNKEHLIAVMKMAKLVAAGKPHVEKMHCYNMPRSKSLYPICIHMYARLMAYGRGAITMMDKHVKDSSHPKIGLIGHASNACADTELKEKLHGHFQKAHRKGSTLHNANCAYNGQQCRCWCVDV